ncbi:chemotaxis protein CheW [Sodalinema gerasimenkoae]|uniref:chemotaxis protein CheW n=1 Tax=Sodalinema gerasimenkoae TaxID=2862348 RepID=UPI00135BA1A8|nr:chemotaxis protein CheW [Sodalinema gerasimenkoae]
MLSSTLHPNLRRFSINQHQRIPKEKLVIFKLENDSYGVSITQVVRVLPVSKIYGEFNEGRGLIQYEGQTIPVLHLELLLLHKTPTLTDEYLLICQLNSAETFAIPTPSLPSVLDVPKDNFCDVPEIYRRGPLGIAIEKVVNLPDEQVLLYLNLDHLLHEY